MNILEFITQEGQLDLQSYVDYLFTLNDSENTLDTELLPN